MTGEARSYAPGSHYDRVTAAWTLLLGEELHYGVFARGNAPLPDATAELTRLMIDASGLEPGLEVLDVGCGTGAPACRLAAEHNVRVTGITTSGVGVERARARVAEAGLDDRVGFEQRDGMDNGFPDASFDRAWVLEASHLMRRRDRLVAECARVLRPGGRFALCDIVLTRELPFMEVRRLREPLALLREVFGDARMEPPEVYAKLAEENGLKVDEVTDLTAATRPTFARWRENVERHRDEVESALGSEEVRKFADAADVLERLWDDGVLGYALVAAAKS
jgi:cyclopropane fatty-acyl-phospholipid synthase-like methyltransferase